ncbi:MAG: DUF5615 family PIN-like protein [Geobacteraceae bacterium]
MNIRFFLDEDVHAELGHALRSRGFDVIHAQELNRKGRSDKEQLEYAVQDGRCFFSFNVKDFVKLHNQYVMDNMEHWGIIVSKQLPLGETLKRLLRLANAFPRDSIRNRIEFL